MRWQPHVFFIIYTAFEVASDTDVCSASKLPGKCSTPACLQTSVALRNFSSMINHFAMHSLPEKVQKHLTKSHIFDFSSMSPRNNVERYASFVSRHVMGESGTEGENTNKIVAEFWLRRTPANSTDCEIHFDNDVKTLDSQGFHVAPAFSVIAYFNTHDQPMVVAPLMCKCPVPGNCTVPKGVHMPPVLPTGETWIAVVKPFPGLAVSLNGRFFHGVCGEDLSGSNAEPSHDWRYSFIVNLYLNHTPAGLSRLGEKAGKASQTLFQADAPDTPPLPLACPSRAWKHEELPSVWDKSSSQLFHVALPGGVNDLRFPRKLVGPLLRIKPS